VNNLDYTSTILGVQSYREITPSSKKKNSVAWVRERTMRNKEDVAVIGMKIL
jgi:hypothetical protein